VLGYAIERKGSADFLFFFFFCFGLIYSFGLSPKKNLGFLNE
jgi:hypothetical protein